MKAILPILLICAAGCTPARRCEPTSELTTGVVQREIYIGMPAPDVAAALGSPNIVSLDENRDEVWIYDKVSSQVEYSSKGSGIWLLVVGGSSEAGYTRRSQQTLTIIVKFDADKQVKDFTYHSSRF